MLLPSIHHNVFVRLVDLDLVHFSDRQDLHQAVPNVSRHILSCATITERERDSFCMVSLTDYILLNLLYHHHLPSSPPLMKKKKDKNTRWSPDHVGKVRDILVQVFVVQGNHDHFLW